MRLQQALSDVFSGDRWNVNAARCSSELETASAGDVKQFDLIASVTKIYTATIFLRLEELGDLSLNDPFSKWLPEESRLLTHGSSNGSITLSHLLSHTSGIPNYYKSLSLTKKHTEQQIENDPGWDFDSVIELAADQTPKPFPTKRAHYSFTNYQLLDRILEQVSGGFSTALKTLITGPLGLQETWLLTKENLQDFDLTTQLHFGDVRYLGARRLASLGAEGGLIASQSDVAKFLSALFQDHLVSNALSKMLANQRPLFPGVNYGLGLMKFSNLISGRAGVVGHMGATGSIACYDPTSKTSLALATNQFTASRKALSSARKLL